MPGVEIKLRTLRLAAAVAAVALLGRRLFAVAGADRAEASTEPAEHTRGQERTRPSRQQGRSAAEWTSFAISCTVLLGIVGTLAYLHFTGGEEPPVIEVAPRLEQVRLAGDRYYLPVEVANRGGTTAQDVRVRLRLADGADRREEAELLITFLAGGASAGGAAVFRQDPRQRPLEVEVVSYLEP